MGASGSSWMTASVTRTSPSRSSTPWSGRGGECGGSEETAHRNRREPALAPRRPAPRGAATGPQADQCGESARVHEEPRIEPCEARGGGAEGPRRGHQGGARHQFSANGVGDCRCATDGERAGLYGQQPGQGLQQRRLPGPVVGDRAHGYDRAAGPYGPAAPARVGVAGFEPTASSSRTKRATKLRHTPCDRISITALAALRQNQRTGRRCPIGHRRPRAGKTCSSETSGLVATRTRA